MPIVVSAANGTLPVTASTSTSDERVQVGARVELHPGRLLRRGVARGAEHRARGFGPARLGERAGETEVGDADDAVLVEEEVRGLDVAVQDPACVRVLERRRDVATDPGGLRHAEERLPVEHRPEAAALEQLEHHERHVVLAPVVDGDDVRMVQRGRDLRLGPEPAEERRVLGQRRVQHLDRDATTQPGVLGDVHATARTGSDGRVQPVTAREHPAREIAHEALSHGDNGSSRQGVRRGTRVHGCRVHGRRGCLGRFDPCALRQPRHPERVAIVGDRRVGRREPCVVRLSLPRHEHAAAGTVRTP